MRLVNKNNTYEDIRAFQTPHGILGGGQGTDFTFEDNTF